MLVGCGVGVMWVWVCVCCGLMTCMHVCLCVCNVCVYVLFVAAPVRMHTSIGYVDAPSLGLLAGEYVFG